MANRNFLLGKGENLVKPIPAPLGGGPKAHPYTFSEAKKRLKPMLEKTVEKLGKLPAKACPDNLAVASITLNPSYIAKSYYPSSLLRAVGLEAIGSRARNIVPEKNSKGTEPTMSTTTELFVKGSRASFNRWVSNIGKWNEATPDVQDLIEIEEISFLDGNDKVKNMKDVEGVHTLEVALHVDETEGEPLLAAFIDYLTSINIVANLKRRFYAGGMCFVEIQAPAKKAKEIADFSLVRVVRKMPTLRLLKPTVDVSRSFRSPAANLPRGAALSGEISVAIFDGGIPAGHPLTQWVKIMPVHGIGPSKQSLYDHGVGVTSAFLFGHINPKIPMPVPFANVDHYRVLDTIPSKNSYELYEVLERIVAVLNTKKYDFINLSLGPEVPIEDDEVHSWTAVLDKYLQDGQTLATVAVGNNGDGDKIYRLDRIQVPSDCVNAVAVGACDSPDKEWERAFYSSTGPGRSPGIVKPDIVDFGGVNDRLFLTVDAINGTKLIGTGGTSFAAPSVLRVAAGIKAHFGPSLNSLAIKALLIHTAEKNKSIDKTEVGWGRVAREIENVVTVKDHVVRVVFQGKLTASRYVRIPIPVPNTAILGKVKISATLCYATEVDPKHSSNYTKSGLEVTFRPHRDKRKDPAQVNPDTAPFFDKSASYVSEEVLRKDAHKWENCLNKEKTFKDGAKLKEPSFDIHFNARKEGHDDKSDREINYALIITMEAPEVKDLYNKVVRRYATQLEALRPIIDIPVRI